MSNKHPENSQVAQISVRKSGGVIPANQLYSFGIRQYEYIKLSLEHLEEFALKTLSEVADDLDRDITDFSSGFGSLLKMPSLAYSAPITLQLPFSPFNFADMLLRFVRTLENGHSRRAKAVQLESYVSNVIDAISPKLGTNINILKVLGETGLINVNLKALDRIITEILINSSEEMPCGGEIKVSTQRLPLFPENLKGPLSNLSIGYYAAIIFVDKSKNTAPSSRLTMAGLIAKESRGAISVDTLPDGGRMCIVYLPLCTKTI